ncbi:adenylyltransferase/cytidyltransferase family protein [Candidatus Parcubacteria bacterium]|nr:adenylyltransferase/cytidyltransferase family protein [Candidatus Parcubacteria bacterium]
MKILLIGRWQPFHDGHKTLVDEALNKGHKVIIGIRDTEKDDKNPFSVNQRKRMIKKIYGEKVDIIAIPDIDAVWIGRKVGYKVVQLPKHIEKISGTEIRKQMRKDKLL